MSIRKRGLSLALAFVMILGLVSPVYGADREEIITIALSYTDGEETALTEDVKAGDEFGVDVNFYGNPVSSAESSICSAALMVVYDSGKVTPVPEDSYSNLSTEPTINMKRADGTAVYIGWASPNGLVTGSGKNKVLLSEGTLVTLMFTAKENIALSDLDSVFVPVDGIKETLNGEEKVTKAFLSDGVSTGMSHGMFQIAGLRHDIEEQADYTVTFDPNVPDGETVSGYPATLTLKSGEKVKEPETAPTRTGYVFQGWYQDKECTTEAVFNRAAASNLTLYAKWEKSEFTLTFDAGAGTLTEEATVVRAYQDSYDITQSAAIDDHAKRFDGWYDAQTGGNKVTTWNAESNLTLYARFVDKDVLTLTFDANGVADVTGMPDAQNVIINETAVAPTSNPTAKGHEFQGWFADKEGKSAWSFDTALTESVTVYAKWQKNTYTLTLNPGDGKVIDGDASVSKEYQDPYEIAQKAENNDHFFAFDGWFTAQEGGEQATRWNAESDLTLYAHYSKKPTVFVTFDAMKELDGYPKSQEVVKGEAATEPESPSADGYGFDGWYLETTGKTKWDFSQTLDEDLRLYAKWSLNKRTLTFVPGEGTMSGAKVERDYGSSYNISETPTPNNRLTSFEGWYTAADGGEKVTVWDAKTDLTLYARYQSKNTVTVTFAPNLTRPEPAGMPEPQTILVNETVKKPETDPTAEGYRFAGWYADAEGEKEWDFERMQAPENTTIYAKWIINQYTLTLNPGAGKVVGDAKVTRDLASEYEITQTATPNDGTTEFLGWFDAQEGGTQVTKWDAKADLTLYAQYKKKADLTVTYVSDGQTYTTKTVPYGGKAEAVTPEKAGHTFGGWLLNEEAYDFSKEVTENLTLTAKWTVNQYTLTLDPGAGKVIGDAKVTRDYASEYAITQTAEPDDGMTEFQGWFDAQEGGAQVTKWDAKADLTLYARYKSKDALTVTYVSDGQTYTTKTVPYGGKAEALAPEKAGHTFGGWLLNEEAYDFTKEVTENLTLTAKWTVNQYALTLDPGAGKVVGDAVVTRDYASEYAITQTAEPDDDATEFQGWFDAQEGGTQITKWDVEADLTLYARYKLKAALTVTFISEDSVYAVVTAPYGGAVEEPAAPSRPGYAFGGWMMYGQAYDFSRPVTGNFTLTAQWIPGALQVTFDSNGGSAVDAQNVAEGATATIPETPVMEGHTFVNWLLKGRKYDFSTPVTKDITLTAAWVRNIYTVTFADADEIPAQKVSHGDKVLQPTNPVSDNGVFEGWNLDGAPYDFETPVTEDITLTAAWRETAFYTVFFDSDGGSETPDQRTPEGEPAVRPRNPERDGYAFAGWQLEEAPYDFDAPVTADITLKATWTDSYYTASFDSNGGSKVNDQRVAQGGLAEKPEDPTQDGWQFDGWKWGNEDYNFDVPVEEDLMLIAVWSKVYSIRLDLKEEGDGALSEDSGFVRVAPHEYVMTYRDGSVNLPINLPIPDDVVTDDATYTFVGWKKPNEDNSDAKQTAQADLGDAKYEAVWKEGVREGEVKLSGVDANSKIQGLDGLADGDDSAAMSTGAERIDNPNSAQQLAAVLKEIAGIQKDEGNVAMEMDIALQPEDAEDEQQKAIREMAVRNVADIALRFDFLNVTLNKVLETARETVEALGRVVDIPLRYDMSDLYQAAVFSKSASGATRKLAMLSSKPVSAEDAPDNSYYVEGSGQNAVIHVYTSTPGLYSIVTQDKETYTLSFNTNGGSAVPSQETTGVVNVPAPPLRNGYSFRGWYTSASGTKLFDFTQPISADTTAYAQWSLISGGGSSSSGGGSGSSGSSGGGSGSSSAPKLYPVTVEKSANGTVTASESSIGVGKKVTLTLNADEGYEAGVPVVKNSRDKALSLTKNSDGTYTFRQASGGVTVSASFNKKADSVPPETDNAESPDISPDTSPDKSPDTSSGSNDTAQLHSANGALDEPEIAFTDVSESKYYYQAVVWAVKNNITQGRTSSTFAPDASCTRAQTVTFLWRAAGEPKPTLTKNPFTDVKEGAYYYQAVLWALEQGITKGLTETEFSPNASVNRAQVVTFLYRSEKLESWSGRNDFSDVPRNSYYYDAVSWALETGVTKGETDTRFAPKSPCTRAQIVTFLYRHYASKSET